MRWILLTLALCWGAAGAASPPAVAAAADLKFVLPRLAEAFQRETGLGVRLAFGSSGNLTRQLEQGAPFELFLSADETYISRLAQAGVTEGEGVLYAVGRVVLFAPHGSPLTVDGRLKDLEAALADGRLRRFAIANPEHAPYGRAARAVLRHAGLWERIQPRLVLGENASQATQFAAAGPSQGGLVPLSLAAAPEVARQGTFALIPAEWHADAPLRQRMALVKGAGGTARAFYAYLQGFSARDTLARHGFSLPAE